MIGNVGAWLDKRLKLGATIRETAEHPVPRSTASWLYVFGSAALVITRPPEARNAPPPLQ